jgi:hypothetical protein
LRPKYGQIDSVNLVFFGVSNGPDDFTMNGNASKIRDDVKKAKEDLIVRKPMHWLATKYFSPLNTSDPDVLRSRMTGGLPLKGFNDFDDNFAEQKRLEKLYLEKLLDDVLLPANDKYKHITINWEENTVGLTSIEVMKELSHDSWLALGSVSFVGVLVLAHTMSISLTLIAAVGILLSFPMAFTCYWWCGFRTMKLLNFVR